MTHHIPRRANCQHIETDQNLTASCEARPQELGSRDLHPTSFLRDESGHEKRQRGGVLVAIKGGGVVVVVFLAWVK